MDTIYRKARYAPTLYEKVIGKNERGYGRKYRSGWDSESAYRTDEFYTSEIVNELNDTLAAGNKIGQINTFNNTFD